jgi:hypothetical protein
VAGRRAARSASRGGELIQAPRPARVALAVGAAAAYGGVLADALTRAPSPIGAFLPGAVAGLLLFVAGLLFDGGGLGLALFLAGGTYVAAVAAAGHGVDASAPLVAVLLLLAGELSAWSIDERWKVPAEEQLAWRRGAAVSALALGGFLLAALVVALSAVQPNQGLGWTVLGAAAAVGAAGTGIWVARH